MAERLQPLLVFRHNAKVIAFAFGCRKHSRCSQMARVPGKQPHVPPEHRLLQPSNLVEKLATDQVQPLSCLLDILCIALKLNGSIALALAGCHRRHWQRMSPDCHCIRWYCKEFVLKHAESSGNYHGGTQEFGCAHVRSEVLEDA